MRKDKRTLKEKVEAFSLKLRERYEHWKDIYENGCSDPFWADGVNINLVKNHIYYYKQNIEEVAGNRFDLYPNEYYFPAPLELPNNFVAVNIIKSCGGEVLTCNKTLCYNEVIKFDWGEVL